MRYIRTKDELKAIESTFNSEELYVFLQRFANYRDKVMKIADTIEELCDEFVFIGQDGIPILLDTVEACLDRIKDLKLTNYQIYGAIWTDKGLIYIAKMNEKGELELL